MANNTGLLLVAGLALLWLLGRKPATPPGGVTVTGNLSGVTVSGGSRMGQASMSSHQVPKHQGENVVVVATFSVQANKGDGTPISWPYRLVLSVSNGPTILYQVITDPFSTTPVTNQKWSWAFPAPGAVNDLLNVIVHLHGAAQDLNGVPIAGSWTVLSTKVHPDAIKVLSNQVGVLGNISDVSVSQAPPTMYARRAANPWLNDTRAPI